MAAHQCLRRGSNFVLTADVPGMSDKDLQITLHADSLGISGERKIDAPEGYSIHRQERSGVKFSRSFSLPCKVNAEETSASVRNGVLTITLRKHRKRNLAKLQYAPNENGGSHERKEQPRQASRELA